MTIDAAAPDQIRPCELPCPKCGSGDVHRTYRARGSIWRTPHDQACGYPSKYAGSYRNFTMSANREHIEHHCRTCSHDWQTRPLAKPKSTGARQQSAKPEADLSIEEAKAT